MRAFSSSPWTTITFAAASLTLAVVYFYSGSPAETATGEMSQSISEYGLGLLPSLNPLSFFQNVFAAAETVPWNETSSVEDNYYHTENASLPLSSNVSGIKQATNSTKPLQTYSSNVSKPDTNITINKSDSTLKIALDHSNKGKKLIDEKEYDKARKAFEKAYEIFQKIPNTQESQAVCLGNIGAAYSAVGFISLYTDNDPSQAKDLFLKAIQSYDDAMKKWPNIDEEWQQGKGWAEYEMGVALNSEGSNLSAEKNYAASIKKHLESIEYFKKSYLSHKESPLSHSKVSTAIARTQGVISYNKQALANICLKQKDYSGAMELLLEARNYTEQALKNDPNNEEYQKQSEQLEKNINTVSALQKKLATPTPNFRR
jgi:tetratricopeptide (TPR) repeat protein